ncbi:MAG: response regulator transcription factor [Bacteroidetes bacterium]|nr:response regulator transcription factor [Bacteroidota bacterium]
MSILIADDNSEMRDFIAEVITDIATTVYEAADGPEAVASARRCKPDLILMDIRMPGFDGIEATRRILKENPGTKIVIVTECDSREFRRDARESGCLAYVLKEDLDILPETLAGLLHLN